MKVVSSVILLKLFKGQQMDPIGRRRIIFFGEAAAAGMSAAKSDHDYNYEADFEIWREN